MNFSLEKTEHYTLLKTLLTELDSVQVEELSGIVKHELLKEACQYLILNFETIEQCQAAAVRELINLGNFLNENNGLLIISCLNDQFTRLFEKAEIVFVPSDMEAIDYVFMDQIEKQFLNETEEEDGV